MSVVVVVVVVDFVIDSVRKLLDTRCHTNVRYISIKIYLFKLSTSKLYIRTLTTHFLQHQKEINEHLLSVPLRCI
jgi:hypothetical protein